MTLEEKIIEIIAAVCGAEPEEIEPEMDLFEEGLLDSFGTISLLVELEETFGISLKVEELTREQIATPRMIAALVREASQ